ADEGATQVVPVSHPERIALAMETSAESPRKMEATMAALVENHELAMSEVVKGAGQSDAALQAQFNTSADVIKRDMVAMKSEVQAATTAAPAGSVGSTLRPAKITRAASAAPTGLRRMKMPLTIAGDGWAVFEAAPGDGPRGAVRE
ncbi:unnamed protein product, partial [Prorocentrum cordatum]